MTIRNVGASIVRSDPTVLTCASSRRSVAECDLDDLLARLFANPTEGTLAHVADYLGPAGETRGWMDTAAAAVYLGLPSTNALQKIARAGEIRFEQWVANG